ncbi:MAG TPA: hypothetical protein VNP36_15230 [Burkholderiales bacterium]|nr:hypothetical protein [Burkholderiales bacterium]
MNWSEFEDELARRRDAGRPVQFWWRDDDAGAVLPPLKQLIELSRKKQIPLALAVVPETAESELFRLLHDRVTVLQHGTDHRNRASPGEKKTEYPVAETVEAALARVSDGFGTLRTLAGRRFLPVLAPPWNRVRKDLLTKLPAIGIRGLSGYGARASVEPAPGLRQVNTHVDIVAWRAGKGFIGEEEALSKAMQHLSGEEPVGWLTHHAVHDARAWKFLERLFTLRDIRWLSATEAFSYTAAAHG